ncbi:unnamed protein product, partial [Pylaiella littoralis]
MANEESLAVAFAVALAAAAVCYTVTGASWVRRLIGHRLVRVPLGVAAELLRAGCIASASEIVLALMSSSGVGRAAVPSRPSSWAPTTAEKAFEVEKGGGGGSET